MLKKWYQVPKLKAIFILAFALVFTNAVVLYSNTANLIHNQEWVRYSYEVITQLESIQSPLKDTETAQRNYLIRADADDLQTYLAADQQTNSNIQILSKLTADNHQKQQPKITNRFNILQQEIYRRYPQQILSDKDKQIRKESQQLIHDSLKVEQNLLQDRMHESQASSQKAIVTFFIAAIVDLVLVVLLYDLLRRYIRQLQQAELALSQSENRLRAMIDAEPKCIKLIAKDGTLLEINAYGLAMMEVESADVLIGKPIDAVIVPEYRAAFADLHKSICQGNKGTLKFEIVGFKGTHRYMETHAVPLRNESDGTFMHLALMRDITQQKQVEAQLLRSQRLESIGTLASGIAHDLNNILSPILMSVQLLQKKLPDQQSQQILQTLENNVKRGANLLKQVLSFARGIEGKRTIIQIQPLIEEIEQIIAQTFPKSITCQTDIPKNLWYVRGDITQLYQVLINLLVNARDSMPNGGILRIVAENVVIGEHSAQINIDAKVGSYIAIVVTDTGIGMSSEVQEQIFKPFFTTKEVGKGTGLGLSTTLGIIKNHSGFVNVYSQLGRGTQFTVYLPASTSRDTHSLSPELESVTGDG
ncbi:ATP-binding protein [Nostoc sp.]|uniref:ATP-binding protein n=1 Tax=Nostoc sp. TaxID=1180 RepID=UPI002FFBD5D4